MSEKDVTVLVATYDAQPTAETNFEALKELGKENRFQLHDAAVITKGEKDQPEVISHMTRYGWGKGPVAGIAYAYFGGDAALFGRALGPGGGASRPNFSHPLGRRKLASLSETLDKGKIALIAVVDTDAVDTFKTALSGATEVNSESAGLTADEIAAAMPQETPAVAPTDAAPPAAG